MTATTINNIDSRAQKGIAVTPIHPLSCGHQARDDITESESPCAKGTRSDIPESGGVSGSSLVIAKEDCDLSFEIWEDLDECPHCGSAYIEFDLEYEIAICEDCHRHSASILTDDMEIETWLMNNMDRFDWQDIIDNDHVGGE